MKLLIVFALISLATAIPAPDGAASEKTCEQLTPVVEKGLRRLSLVDNDSVPRTAEEVEKRCNEGKKLYPDFKQFKKCLPGKLTPQIFEESTKSIGEILKSHCSADGQKDLLKVLTCVDDDHLNQIKKISVGSFNEFLKLADSSAEDRAALTARMCCLSHISAQEVATTLEGVKCADASVNPKEHFRQLFAEIQKSGLDLTCGDWKDLAACEAKVGDVVTQLRTGIKGNTLTSIDQSIIEPMKKLASKISD